MRVHLYILLCLFLCACQEFPVEPETENTGEATVSLHINSPQSRALNDTLTNSWEKRVNTASIYVFNPSGKLIYFYSLSSSQITALNNQSSLTINFIVPGNFPSCDIYMVANTTPSASAGTKASLLNSIETDISSYNGAYAQTSTSALRANGFVMTGFQNGVNLSTPATVNISLQRIVAKVAVQIVFSSLISLGTLSMGNAVLTLSAPNSNLFPSATPNTGGTAVSFSQVPQRDNSISSPITYRALFYIYENAARAPANTAVTITFRGTNTVLVVTTPFSYQFTLTGDSGGKISRNRVYFINATITKLIDVLPLSILNDAIEISVDEEPM